VPIEQFLGRISWSASADKGLLSEIQSTTSETPSVMPSSPPSESNKLRCS